MDFFDIRDEEAYDGIWACASVLHVEKSRIPKLLEVLYKALKKGGILYLSFKYGDHNGFRDGRHFSDLNENRFSDLLDSLYCDSVARDEFELVDEWKSEDVRRGKNVEWLNVILRKSNTV